VFRLSGDLVPLCARGTTDFGAPELRIVSGADAASPLDKYVKRKKLEPLETYVPAVLLTIDQFVDLEKSLEFEKPRFDETRSLLRSGPASSLRINIRAVAQYADSTGQGKAASDAVDECLRALEDLDSLLLHASRNDPTASVETMRSKISVALGALDNLLQTVPSAVLDKGKVIADAYRTPADDYVEENAAELDPKLKELEDIL